MNYSKLKATKNELAGPAVAIHNIFGSGGVNSRDFAVLASNGKLYNMHTKGRGSRGARILRQDVAKNGTAPVVVDQANFVVAQKSQTTRLGELAHFSWNRARVGTNPVPLTLISFDDAGTPRTNINTDKIIAEIKSADGSPEALAVIAQFQALGFPSDFELDESGLGVVPISETGEYVQAAIELAFADEDDVEDLDEVEDEELAFEDFEG